MNRLISLLGIVLAIQLLLAVFFGITTSGVSGVANSEPLMSFAVKAVERITIEQPQKTSLIVERRENNWLLPSLGDFPALTVKVEGFLDRLKGLHKRLPVSTTASALSRFKVSPTVYEHKIMLGSGNTVLTTLWLGDSAGFRQVHGRTNEENAIYNLDFAIYEVSTDPNQWADKTILNLNPEEISKIALADITLIRDKDSGGNQENNQKGDQKEQKLVKWQVDQLAPEEALNAEAINSIVNRLTSLSFESVLGKENQANYRQEAPILTLAITMQTGEQRDYVFSIPVKEAKSTSAKDSKAEPVTEYILKTSSSPYYFKIAEFMMKELLETKRAKLIKKLATQTITDQPTVNESTTPDPNPQ